MAEAATQIPSLALYTYMCHNIVGTEEYVKTLRMINAVRDNIQYNKDGTPITSGSFGEGLEMRGSDLDIMIVLKIVEVNEDPTIHFQSDTIYFKMDTDDTQTGFTKLRLLHSKTEAITHYCNKIGNVYYYSNSLFKQEFKNYFISTVHGPCLSDESGYVDAAFCLRSKSWISQAKQWITRSNNSWPRCDVKQSIIEHGIIFVPIGVKGSTREDLEWRISFSVGGKLLINTFTHTQLLCYALMKICLKDVIALDLDCKELLCSYYIKTIMLWLSEELSPSIWKPENLISCFMRCLRRLVYCVEYSVCQHYFMPENNLFQNKMKGQPREVLLNKLNIINSYGWECILLSDQITNFGEFDIRKEPSCLHVNNVKQVLSPVMYSANNIPVTHEFLLEKVMKKVLSIKSSKIKYMYTYHVSKSCYRSAQLLPLEHFSNNRSTYKQYTTRMGRLLVSTPHDAVSGWLLLASFFYHSKQYKLGLHIIRYSLSKCTLEKLQKYENMVCIPKDILNLHLYRKMTNVQIRKYLLLDRVLFEEKSVIIPDELKNEVKTRTYSIQSEVYAHFLRFLCHLHLKNIKQCLYSIRDLQGTIEDNYLMSGTETNAVAFNILGISFQLFGDIKSAKQAFTQSIECCQNKDDNSAFQRLSSIS